MKKTSEDTALILKRTLPYPADALFRALSDAEIMTRWFFAAPDWSAQVSNEFRVGGKFEIRMLSPKGNAHPHHGVYKEIVPGKKLAFTWNSHIVEDTLVTITLETVPEGTELTLVHEFLPDEHRNAHHEGWTGCLDNLGLFLATSKS